MKNFPSLPGIAIGIVIGFLIAPAKGSRTRNKVAYKTKAFTHELSQLFYDADIKLPDIKNAFINEALYQTSGIRENIYGIMGGVKALNNKEPENNPY